MTCFYVCDEALNPTELKGLRASYSPILPLIHIMSIIVHTYSFYKLIIHKGFIMVLLLFKMSKESFF